MSIAFAAIAYSLIALGACAFLLRLTPRGLASPGTGLVLKLSALLALGARLPWEVAPRRAKNERDLQTIGKKAKGDLAVEEANVPGGEGSPLRLRVYRPTESKTGKPQAGRAVLFIHGGGHVLGSLEGYDSFARLLSLGTGSALVAVDYRLAPEHPFPAAPRDVMAAYKWMLAERAAGRLGAGGIFVVGDSAGGNLAAVLCQQAAAAGLEAPAGCVLLCPVTDLSRMDGDSYARFGEGYLLTKEEMLWFRSLYLPEAADRSDPAASPLLARDLSGQPPSLVIVAEFDVLRDEGEAYAERLRQAGASVVSRRVPGTIHDFVVMSRFTSLAGRAIRMVGEFMEPSHSIPR